MGLAVKPGAEAEARPARRSTRRTAKVRGVPVLGPPVPVTASTLGARRPRGASAGRALDIAPVARKDERVGPLLLLPLTDKTLRRTKAGQANRLLCSPCPLMTIFLVWLMPAYYQAVHEKVNAGKQDE